MINPTNILGFLALLAVTISLIGASLSYYLVHDLQQNGLSGYATFGTVNLTVESVAMINFTTETINFGSGRVNLGSPNATLNSSGAGSVANGNWTNPGSGFVIENIGNNNVSINLMSDKTAAQFLSGTSPSFQLNVSNLEANSCTNNTDGGLNMSLGAYILGSFIDVNTTSPGQRVCDRLSYSDTRDRIRVDVRLVVPGDGLTGALGARITAAFSAVP